MEVDAQTSDLPGELLRSQMPALDGGGAAAGQESEGDIS